MQFSEIPFLTVGAKSSREVADELLKQGSKLTAQRNAVEDEMIKVILTLNNVYMSKNIPMFRCLK